MFVVLALDLIGIPTPMSLKRSQGVLESDEETPLLHDGHKPQKETPLPITQVFILLFLQLCDPITSQSINPYINQVCLPIPIIQVIGNAGHSSSVNSQ